MFCYLFEAKSIQSYLFRNGKLKDVIAASERLDRLVDSSESSVLHYVLNNAGLTSDLLSPDMEEKAGLIRFLRCKGGAFYAYCAEEAPLVQLRSLWTLSIQQLFPTLEFTDALTEAPSLREAVSAGHKQVAADRNAPVIKLPFASAITSRYQRTGAVRVPVIEDAKRASLKSELEDDTFDLDTSLHRQAYQVIGLRNTSPLQQRFTPTGHDEIYYPINIEEDFAFSASGVIGDNSDAAKDIALIHIDGNGLGILLMAMRDALEGKTDEEYRKGFRLFSESLGEATIQAAREATAVVYEHGRYSKDGKTYLPMRPLVLGGDDLTLLCRADLALEYSRVFCQTFKKASEQCLKPLFRQYLKKTSLKPFLTASGGVLFHKAGHPFTHSHHLVESLCDAAKKLTKSVNETDKQVGPAALAIFRLSNAVSDDFEQLHKQTYQFDLDNKRSIAYAQSAFFVEPQGQRGSLELLQRLAKCCRQRGAVMPMNRWRQMATWLSQGNFAEADRLYERAMSLTTQPMLREELEEMLRAFAPEGKATGWFWHKEKGVSESIIGDLLIVDHFRPVEAPVSKEAEL